MQIGPSIKTNLVWSGYADGVDISGVTGEGNKFVLGSQLQATASLKTENGQMKVQAGGGRWLSISTHEIQGLPDDYVDFRFKFVTSTNAPFFLIRNQLNFQSPGSATNNHFPDGYWIRPEGSDLKWGKTCNNSINTVKTITETITIAGPEHRVVMSGFILQYYMDDVGFGEHNMEDAAGCGGINFGVGGVGFTVFSTSAKLDYIKLYNKNGNLINVLQS